jgi:hypothetical protein
VFSPVAGGIAEGCGGGGARQHLKSSIRINVRPARLIERAAALTEPMPFELHESEREGAGESEERTRRPVGYHHYFNISGSDHACGESAGDKGPAERWRSHSPTTSPPTIRSANTPEEGEREKGREEEGERGRG